MTELIGIGLYTPAEAGKLLQIPSKKISRWLRGHSIGERFYAPLWQAQVNLDDGHLYLGFRDLMEVRIADRFIAAGLSPQRVRAAVTLAREVLGKEHPLSTDRFRTDGRDIFLKVVQEDESGEEKGQLLNLFRRQFEFKQIIEPLLKTVDLDDKGHPVQWWPLGQKGKILVDPARAFGRPIDSETSVPTAILAAAGQLEGVERAALAYDVPVSAIRRAMVFESDLEQRVAA
jgi:hypothetical protein